MNLVQSCKIITETHKHMDTLHLDLWPRSLVSVAYLPQIKGATLRQRL